MSVLVSVSVSAPWNSSLSGLYLPSSFCLSVCPLATSMHCGKTAESIEMSFRVVVRVSRRNHALDGGPDFPFPHGKGQIFNLKVTPLQYLLNNCAYKR